MKFKQNTKLILILLLIISINDVKGQFCVDTLVYKAENYHEKLFPSVVFLTFYPDSTYLREDFYASRGESLNGKIPERKYGTWDLEKQIIILNKNEGKENPFYQKFRLRKNSIKFIPNREHLRVGKLKYQWIYLTKAGKLRKIKSPLSGGICNPTLK
jgi:hypothetical protein